MLQEESELSGLFEQDYLELCKKLNVKPLNILKFTQLPPLPTGPLEEETEDGLEALEEEHEELPQELSKSSVMLHASQPVLQAEQKQTYVSRFKYTPTMNIELTENEEEEETYKISLRGYRINTQQIQLLNSTVPACVTLSQLVLWNCGLTGEHFTLLTNLVERSGIRHLTLDQNPLIPEVLYCNLILSEDSAIKNLVLRGNKITDIGCRLLGQALKSNRTLTNLNLFDNKIGFEGAEALAEGLKLNTVLQSLSLAKNNIKDDGVVLLAKALSNIALSAEEVQQRKKLLMEMDKKHELEDDATKKKGRPGRGGSAKATEDKKDPKKQAQNAKPQPTKKQEPPRVQQKTPDDQKNKKDDKKPKDKKSVQNLKGKKGKPEEVKDEQEEVDIVAADPMFEVNGQSYVLGNRSLNSLNLSCNSITEQGVKALLEVVLEQEATADQLPEGLLGIFRIVLQYNPIEQDSQALTQLQGLLNTRNPFFEAEPDALEIGEQENSSELEVPTDGNAE
ncbi:hypothetical protein EDD86DRAFT_213233 [Gorgonomyces haynaldii]|nr:hypothetical protein EDD86DRAFT_213233 [Gorgonomyces haynaldii]